jgi:general secretion pathway protein M
MPSGRPARLLALLLLLVVLAAVYLLLVAPVLGLYRERAAILDERLMLAPRLSAAGAEVPALRARLATLAAASRARKVTLDGASDAIASANLESRIDALAAAAGATVGSTESLPAKAVGPYRRIGLRVVLSGSYQTLVKLLAALDGTPPPLVIDDLEIHGMILPQSQPRNLGLNVSLNVYGFRSSASARTAKR